MLGEHSERVLRGIVGLSNEDFALTRSSAA